MCDIVPCTYYTDRKSCTVSSKDAIHINCLLVVEIFDIIAHTQVDKCKKHTGSLLLLPLLPLLSFFPFLSFLALLFGFGKRPETLSNHHTSPPRLQLHE